MSRLFYNVMQDNAGNLLFDVTGTMRHAGTGTLATIYGDEARTVILPNPMTNHPNFGSFKCFLAPGDYDFYMAKAGYTFETLTGVQGLGTMAQQDAHNVAITGGTLTGVQVPNTAGSGVVGLASILAAAGGTGRHFLLHQGDALSYLGGQLQVAGTVGINTAPPGNARMKIDWNRNVEQGLIFRAITSTTGGGTTVTFFNTVDSPVGNINASETTTAYNTTSDARLKHDVATLTGELEVIRALRPVSFRWNADEAPGVGFLAHEVAAQVQGVITGAPDALDADGGILPQQIDYSKLVPWLVGAVQTLAARVAVLEDALGV